MPGGDGTGPGGFGPMTGRAAGYCAGYPMPGFMNPIPGRGFGGGGRGFGGRGRGWARAGWLPAWGGAPYDPYGYPPYGMTYPYGAGYSPYGAPASGMTYPYGAGYSPYGGPVSQEQELDALKGQAEYFEDALDGIRKRIEELVSAQKKK